MAQRGELVRRFQHLPLQEQLRLKTRQNWTNQYAAVSSGLSTSESVDWVRRLVQLARWLVELELAQLVYRLAQPACCLISAACKPAGA